jgi:hypothetical protein
MSDGMSDSRRETRANHHLDMGLRYLDEAISEFYDPAFGGADPRVLVEMNKILGPYGLAVVEKKSTTRK